MTPIQCFLAAKADHFQLGISEFHEALGSQWLRGRHKSIKGSSRRCQRHLLFENNMDQGMKPLLSLPQRRRSESGHNRRESPIPRRKQTNGTQERLSIERL